MADQADGKNWQRRGHCRYHDPELFFPIGNGLPVQPQIAEAKAVCRSCPVVTRCLTWALDTGQDAGVWGGMTEDERRRLKRRESRQRQREQTLVSSTPITVADEAVA